MEVFVSSPGSRFCNLVFPDGSLVRDVLTRFTQQQGVSSSEDFYVTKNGRLSQPEELLQRGAVYHLEPRLRGGKGGFGSMLRALGAQIEKTTNREACRDLSGRRLRDVNHEKEMAEWLKKQTEREAEKEQRRLERLQRKLSEPRHQFADPQYQQQCHDLSERLEDSVIKGLQASSSAQVKADDVSAAKRTSCDESEQPHRKRKKKTAAACFWTGVGEMLSSEDEDEEESAAVTMTMEPEQSSSSSAASDCSSSSADQTCSPAETAAGVQRPAETAAAGVQRPAETAAGVQRPAETAAGVQRPAETAAGVQSPEETAGPSEGSDSSSQQQDRPAVDPSPVDPSSVDPSPVDPSPVDPSPVDPSSVDPSSVDPSPVDLSSVSSAAELESLGLNVLKEELMSRGLKCGGTLTERAARLFSVRGLTPGQIDPALLAKPAKTKRK